MNFDIFELKSNIIDFFTNRVMICAVFAWFTAHTGSIAHNDHCKNAGDGKQRAVKAVKNTARDRGSADRRRMRARHTTAADQKPEHGKPVTVLGRGKYF